MGARDPLLRMSDHQHRDVLGAYTDAEAFRLGWPARAALAAGALVLGAGCGAVVVVASTWRRVVG